jgi:hypothetical protein
MLLTLAAGSLRSLISADGGGSMSLLDVPEFSIGKLQLRGVNVPSSMLAGWSLEDLDRLRDRGDKAGCPCLVLVEDTPLAFAGTREKTNAAGDRVQRLAVAANRLGCNALAVRCEAPDTEQAFDRTAERLKAVMPAVERMELNLLVAPHAGLTAEPDRLTDLALRKLAPYAGAVHATVQGFDKKGAHRRYDLAQGVNAIRSVGFLNTLAIDYVGNGDAVDDIEKAREILQRAIDSDEPPA